MQKSAIGKTNCRGEVYAFYWRRWSNRTFFVFNADGEIVSRLKCFATRWAGTKAELILP